MSIRQTEILLKRTLRFDRSPPATLKNKQVLRFTYRPSIRGVYNTIVCSISNDAPLKFSEINPCVCEVHTWSDISQHNSRNSPIVVQFKIYLTLFAHQLSVIYFSKCFFDLEIFHWFQIICMLKAWMGYSGLCDEGMLCLIKALVPTVASQAFV